MRISRMEDALEVSFEEFMELSYPPSTTEFAESRSSASSFSDSSVNSEDCGYTMLERHHFDKALNQGVFNEFTAKEKRKRKKNYEKGTRKSNEDLRKGMGALEREHRERARRRSTSFDIKELSRKNSAVAKQHKFRHALFSNDMGLFRDIDMADLDQLHDLRQEFFGKMQITDRSHGSYVSLDSCKEIDDSNYPIPLQHRTVLRLRSSTVL